MSEQQIEDECLFRVMVERNSIYEAVKHCIRSVPIGYKKRYLIELRKEITIRIDAFGGED